MAREVTMFKAYDGEVFEMAEDCVVYEKRLMHKEKVAEFLASPQNIYNKPAHLTVAENTLLAFNDWSLGVQTEVLLDEEEIEDGSELSDTGREGCLGGQGGEETVDSGEDVQSRKRGKQGN